MPPMEDGPRESGKRAGFLAGYRRSVRQLFINRDHIHRCAGEWVEKNRPALVLLDAKLLLYAAPFLEKKIPIINLNANLSAFYSPGSPPVFSGLFPAEGRGVWTRLRGKMAWTRIFFDQRIMELFGNINFRLAFGTAKFQTTAARIKLLGGKMARTEYGLRLRLPEIVLEPRVIDFPCTDDERYRHYAGICVDEDRVFRKFRNMAESVWPMVKLAQSRENSWH